MDEDEMMRLIPPMLLQVKTNLAGLQEEWKEVQAMAACSMQPQQAIAPDEVVMTKSDLDNLASEAEQMKTSLSKIMSINTLAVMNDVSKVQEDLHTVRAEKDSLLSEVSHWKTQLDLAFSEGQKVKQEQLELRIDVQELTNQLSQQSEFCSSLGASCCTLLWRVSRHEDSVQNIISGNRTDEFLCLTANSIQSYLNAYKDDQWPQQGTDEATFLLALCGIVTNVAASALGREYLASHSSGQRVMDVFVTFITEAPMGKSCAMKNLMLMSLYNVSINQKGLGYLCGKQGMVSMLSWHLKEETDVESQIGSLRLLQSLISDESNPRLVHELKENLPVDFLHQLSKSSSKEIQELSLDLVMDLRHLGNMVEQ